VFLSFVVCSDLLAIPASRLGGGLKIDVSLAVMHKTKPSLVLY
jgi:hypothetical protein